jgi:hypothetical protein
MERSLACLSLCMSFSKLINGFTWNLRFHIHPVSCRANLILTVENKPHEAEINCTIFNKLFYCKNVYYVTKNITFYLKHFQYG